MKAEGVWADTTKLFVRFLRYKLVKSLEYNLVLGLVVDLFSLAELTSLKYISLLRLLLSAGWV